MRINITSIETSSIKSRQRESASGREREMGNRFKNRRRQAKTEYLWQCPSGAQVRMGHGRQQQRHRLLLFSAISSCETCIDSNREYRVIRQVVHLRRRRLPEQISSSYSQRSQSQYHVHQGEILPYIHLQ